MVGRSFRWHGHVLELVPAGHVSIADGVERVEPLVAEGLLRELVADPGAVGELRRLAGASLSYGAPFDDRQLLARLGSELALGRLVLLRRGSLAGSPGYQGKAAARAEPVNAALDGFEALLKKDDDTHWIEFRLVDEDGVVQTNRAYVLVTSDGREFRGHTDSLGCVRRTRIPGGNCTVTFPDLGGAA